MLSNQPPAIGTKRRLWLSAILIQYHICRIVLRLSIISPVAKFRFVQSRRKRLVRIQLDSLGLEGLSIYEHRRTRVGNLVGRFEAAPHRNNRRQYSNRHNGNRDIFTRATLKIFSNAQKPSPITIPSWTCIM